MTKRYILGMCSALALSFVTQVNAMDNVTASLPGDDTVTPVTAETAAPQIPSQGWLSWLASFVVSSTTPTEAEVRMAEAAMEHVSARMFTGDEEARAFVEANGDALLQCADAIEETKPAGDQGSEAVAALVAHIEATTETTEKPETPRTKAIRLENELAELRNQLAALRSPSAPAAPSAYKTVTTFPETAVPLKVPGQEAKKLTKKERKAAAAAKKGVVHT